MPRSRAALPAPLARAAGRFERWRAHRTTRRIPEELWALATELGARHGVSRTSRALHVQYDDLKKRVEAVTQSAAEETGPPTFVELRNPSVATASERGGCRVEFERASGEKMRVELNGAHDADLARLTRLFFEGGPVIQLTAHMRILVAIEPADFRKGIDGLARLCRDELSSDPFEGAVFVFRNRKATMIRILCYDGSGFWLCHKRLSAGRFRYWPSGQGEGARSLQVPEVQLLLSGGDPAAARTAAERWRPLKTVG